jgi:hypothetical protein
VKALVLAMVAGTALAVTCSASAAVKTIVLVHGAFSDGSGWRPVCDINHGCDPGPRCKNQGPASAEDAAALAQLGEIVKVLNAAKAAKQ